LAHFNRRDAPRVENPRGLSRAARRRRRSARLRLRQSAGAFCIDPEQAPAAGGYLHQFKTTARIALSR
jgi:hypothetical protein